MASIGILLFFGLLFLQCTRPTSVTFLTDSKYPCAFIDTVNVTGSNTQGAYRNSTNFIVNDHYNGSRNDMNTIPAGNFSLIYNWMEIPREFIAVYDFIVENGVRIPVARHLRACVCKLKPCIRFCCAQDYYYDITNRTCNTIVVGENIVNTLDQSKMIVRGQNGSYYTISTEKQFSVHIGASCERMRAVYGDNKELIQWILLENGTIAYKHHHFTKHYCYSPFQLENSTWIWQPLACPVEKLSFVVGVREWTYVICLILSTICMAIIFLMHLFCTELRNTFYGVAIKVYSLCIIAGHSLMIQVVLTDPSKLAKYSCTLMACFILLFLLLSFYVLTFVSLNFYLNFHGIVLTKLMFWLIFFPIASLAVGWSTFVGLESYGGKPVFGGDTCWFDPRNWAIMVFFNGPVLVACSVCIFFYIITLIVIRDRQDNGSKSQGKKMDENRFNSFWQFFSYNFITWLVCVISFVINFYRVERTHINYAVCLAVILHGFGSLYALVGKNQQIQNFLRRIEDGIEEYDDEAGESALPMARLDRD